MSSEQARDFGVQVLGCNLFARSRFGFEERIAIIEGDFMAVGLALVAHIQRHLPLVVRMVFCHPHPFGVHPFGKLVLFVGRLQVQPLTEILLNELAR